MVGKRGFEVLQIPPYPPSKINVAVEHFGLKYNAKNILKYNEYQNVKCFSCGCLVSLSCAWECWFGFMCEMAGAFPPLVKHLFPPCGERSFAKRSEAKRDKETVRDG